MRILLLILTFLFLKISAHALPEERLKEEFDTKLLPFLKTGETFRFDGERGVLLAGIRFVHPESETVKGAFVVLPGRSEPYLKYVEVFYDLYAKGYDIYSYDHRGQGLSPHLSSHRAQIGHIDSFYNYVRDLNRFTHKIVAPKARGPLYLLAHSMGGGIATRYLIDYKNPYAKAVLSAPMIDLSTKPYPRFVASFIVGTATFIGLGNRYTIGKGDYEYDIPIAESDTTHSEARTWMQDELTRQNPETAVGGPSNKWVKVALKESRKTQSRARSLETPTLFLQAGEDTLVVNSKQDRFCSAAPNCRIHELPSSRHEVLMEVDPIRNDAFVAIDSFLEPGPSTRAQ